MEFVSAGNTLRGPSEKMTYFLAWNTPLSAQAGASGVTADRRVPPGSSQEPQKAVGFLQVTVFLQKTVTSVLLNFNEKNVTDSNNANSA